MYLEHRKMAHADRVCFPVVDQCHHTHLCFLSHCSLVVTRGTLCPGYIYLSPSLSLCLVVGQCGSGLWLQLMLVPEFLSMILLCVFCFCLVLVSRSG